jgi:prolyl 4-hydroxylase
MNSLFVIIIIIFLIILTIVVLYEKFTEVTVESPDIETKSLIKQAHIPIVVPENYNYFPKNLLNHIKLGDSRIQLYIVDNFLDDNECNTLIKNSTGKFIPSDITTKADKYFRTSKTYHLEKNNFNDYIDEKIIKFMDIPKKYSESTQVQYYDVGNEFKPHTDWFSRNTEEWNTFAGGIGYGTGQRTWTFTIYLNDDFTGGTTNFINLDLKVIPKKGMAVIWNNLYTNGEVNEDTLHTGTKVDTGSKYIITKWFRDSVQ